MRNILLGDVVISIAPHKYGELPLVDMEIAEDSLFFPRYYRNIRLAITEHAVNMFQAGKKYRLVLQETQDE